MSDRLVTTSGLVLRPWRLTDVQELLEAFSPAEMSRQAGEPIDTVEAAQWWLRGCVEDWQRGCGFSWAVVDADGAAIGNVTVTDVERRHDTGWVSYWTVPAARGRGVATCSVSVVANWAFDQIGLFRLELGHRMNNPASCRVATAAGFLAEGVERQKLRYGEQRHDLERHARLATDPVPELRDRGPARW